MNPILFKELREVKTLITTEIREAVNEKRTPADSAKRLTEGTNIDQVKWVLAETVKANDWDGRYSRKVKEWANQLFIPGLYSEDGRKHGAFDGPHPAHINQLIEAVINQG